MPPLDRNHSHRISVADAAVMIRRYREATQGDPTRPVCGAFLKGELLELLGQPGCSGIRLYVARGVAGEPHVVAVGVDAAGADMTSGQLMEEWLPCPPYCDPASALLA